MEQVNRRKIQIVYCHLLSFLLSFQRAYWGKLTSN